MRHFILQRNKDKNNNRLLTGNNATQRTVEQSTERTLSRPKENISKIKAK